MKIKKIKSVSWLYFQNDKVLCVRTKGRDKFYIPGGKIEPKESLEEALHREIHEELNVELVKGSLSPAITISAPAHGFSDDTSVEMHCFLAQYKGTISVNSEIEEINWINYNSRHKCALAAQRAIEFLKENGHIHTS